MDDEEIPGVHVKDNFASISQAVDTALTQEVETTDAEFEKRIQEKGKVQVFEESIEQPRKVKSSTQAQIDMDYELARKSEEEDVARFMEQQRIQKEIEPEEIVPIPNTEEGVYQLTNEEIEHMIDSDPVIKKKAIELIADESLTAEQRSAQLADFINVKNNQAFDSIVDTIKNTQKKPRQLSQAQVIGGMKKYLCHVGGWKMYQLKGKSYEEIQRLYYQEYRRDKDFLPMHSEAEAKRYKIS